MESAKETLKRYLQAHHETLLWKLEGLGEREIRWPRTPTGTNLLGLLKHVAGVEFGYLGPVFDRPVDEPLPWNDPEVEPNADMWATAEESRQEIVALYRRAWAHAERAIDELDLDSVGTVPWWPPERSRVTLHQILVHLVAELSRHAGHADIVRELTDGAAGLRPAVSSLPGEDEIDWDGYVARLRRVAQAAVARE